MRKLNRLLNKTKLAKIKRDFKFLKIMLAVSLLAFLAGVVLGLLVHYGLAIAFTIIFMGLTVYGLLRMSNSSTR